MSDICIAVVGTYVLGGILLNLIHYFDERGAKKYRKQNAIAAARRAGIEQEHLNTE